MKKKLSVLFLIALFISVCSTVGKVYAQETRSIEATDFVINIDNSGSSNNYEDGLTYEEQMQFWANLLSTGGIGGVVTLSDGGGYLLCTYSISTLNVASEIGLRNMELRNKETGTSSYMSQSLGSVYKYSSTTYMGSFRANNPQAGRSYKFVAEAYAYVNGNTYTADIETDYLDWY